MTCRHCKLSFRSGCGDFLSGIFDTQLIAVRKSLSLLFESVHLMSFCCAQTFSSTPLHSLSVCLPFPRSPRLLTAEHLTLILDATEVIRRDYPDGWPSDWPLHLVVGLTATGQPDEADALTQRHQPQRWVSVKMCFSSKLPASKHILDVTPELFHFWWYASSFSGLFPKCLISRCLRRSVDCIGLHSPHFLLLRHSVTICLRVSPALESRCCIFPGLNSGIGFFHCVQQGGNAWPA